MDRMEAFNSLEAIKWKVRNITYRQVCHATISKYRSDSSIMIHRLFMNGGMYEFLTVEQRKELLTCAKVLLGTYSLHNTTNKREWENIVSRLESTIPDAPAERKAPMQYQYSHVGNYQRYTKSGWAVEHAVIMDNGNKCTRTACGAFQAPGTARDRFPLKPANKHDATCKKCRRSIISMTKKGLLEPTLKDKPIGALHQLDDKGSLTSTDKSKEVLLSQLGGKKVFVIYKDMVDIVDNLAEVLEDRPEDIEEIIVVDSYREYEVIKQVKYVLEQVE